MCSMAKLIFASLLLAGVALATPTQDRTKRYAQEPQEPIASNDTNYGTRPPPIQNIINRLSDFHDRLRDIISNRFSNSSHHYSVRDWLERIRHQRNASAEIQEFFKKLNEAWSRMFSSSNATVSSQYIQLLKDLIQIRNESHTAMRNRIDEFFKTIFANLNERLSEPNVTICTRNLRQLRELLRLRIAQRWNGAQVGLQRLLQRIDYIIKQRFPNGIRWTTPKSTTVSGGGSASGSTEHQHSTTTIGNPQTSGEGSASSGASGSAESGDGSGGVSSGSGESGASS